MSGGRLFSCTRALRVSSRRGWGPGWIPNGSQSRCKQRLEVRLGVGVRLSAGQGSGCGKSVGAVGSPAFASARLVPRCCAGSSERSPACEPRSRHCLPSCEHTRRAVAAGLQVNGRTTTLACDAFGCAPTRPAYAHPSVRRPAISMERGQALGQTTLAALLRSHNMPYLRAGPCSARRQSFDNASPAARAR